MRLILPTARSDVGATVLLPWGVSERRPRSHSVVSELRLLQAKQEQKSARGAGGDPRWAFTRLQSCALQRGELVGGEAAARTKRGD